MEMIDLVLQKSASCVKRVVYLWFNLKIQLSSTFLRMIFIEPEAELDGT